MITQQQFDDAFADFEGLVAEGCEANDAVRQAADLHGIDPAVLEKRLTRELSLESRGEKARHDAEYGRFLSAAQTEIETYKANPLAFGSSFDRIPKIKERIEVVLGRELSEHEVWKVGEILSPFAAHLKMTKGKDPEMTKILLRRQLRYDA